MFAPSGSERKVCSPDALPEVHSSQRILTPVAFHPLHLDIVFFGAKKRLLFPKLQGKSTSGQYFHGTARTSRVKALFWGPKKAAEPPEMDYLLKDFILNEFPLKEGSPNADKVKKISVSVVSSILEVSPKDWDACNLDAVGPGNFNPFLTHGFLSSLEESGSAVKETGWIPRHIIARDECENILGVVPLYLKRFDICYAVPRLELLYMLVWAHLFDLACSHSYGEFVFDHSWADAYYSYGARYYPKLQCSVPFTPVTGQRILVRNTPIKDQVFDFLVSAMKDLAVKFQVSSLHITFPSASEWHRLKEKGFLQRTGMQYHWKNRNYKNFDEFLMDMKQSKRKNIRQERKKISTQNLTMKRLRGYEIKARHWDAFYDFYRNTTDNKWGSAYLTREFFHIMGSKLGDHILLVAAEEGDELVAGALNLIGGDAIFGRLWGCLPRAYYPSLHFEACYYQAIEAAIELNLSTVEAGAQGEHKIQRGYLPVTTYSCHYILDEGFREVIDNFLVRETAQVKMVVKLLQESGPFKDGIH
ncbi:hypothetical protein RJ640_024917 [Escallonia rubra]|uniref:Acyl-CoA N-acyltransferase n=1 Tax=Escallonia rubra TaxID=112253 RepID=A0AA88UTY6_9ASTE|nr:hypothetical protein RJ640_024917 [Escallonia rubra]